MKEQELAALVVEWLRADGWDVFQEVTLGDAVADIVAVRKPLVRIVEVKASYSAAVLEQAYRWLPVAHLVSVAVPQRQKRRAGGRDFVDRCAKVFGIGRIDVGDHAFERVRPRLLRHPPGLERLRSALCDRQRDFAPAGNSYGARWTPFAETCERLRAVVRTHPGATVRDCIATIRHHYSADASARSSLVQWARLGKIPGVRIEEGRPLRFWPMA